MGRRLSVGVAVLALLGSSFAPVDAAPGVSPTLIKIGLHAPLTGATPTPNESAEKGKDLLFRWLERRGRSIEGRDVQVILEDDQHNPSRAVDACKKMVEEDHVFMLVGIGGADQITACARYASSAGVPYVSPGVSMQGLRRLPTYFVTSMSWKAQARLLADYLVERFRARSRKNGVVYFNGPTWVEPIQRFRTSMGRRDAEIDYDRSLPQGAGVAEARAVVQEMKVLGIENAFVHTSSVWFLQLLAAANEVDFQPRWVGIDGGIAQERTVRSGCAGGDSLDGARFLSPYPALTDSDRFDPAFRRAAKELEPDSEPDDQMWQLWAMERVLAKMLRLPGMRLSRNRFVAKVERADIKTGILPLLRYRPRDHFGASATHVLRADCTDSRWHTAGTFRNDF